MEGQTFDTIPDDKNTENVSNKMTIDSGRPTSPLKRNRVLTSAKQVATSQKSRATDKSPSKVTEGSYVSRVNQGKKEQSDN